MIIHITCAPGCGKTTLGKYIKSMYPDVVCKDLDDLFEEFKSANVKPIGTYQDYIYDFIKKHKHSKHIIFVGLNWYSHVPRNFFDVKADLKLFMDISNDETIRRKIIRQLPLVTNYMFKNKTIDELYQEVINNPDILDRWGKHVHAKLRNLEPSNIRKTIKEYRKKYYKEGYTFIDYSSLLSLLHDILHSGSFS
jgi:hypothetical protein